MYIVYHIFEYRVLFFFMALLIWIKFQALFLKTLRTITDTQPFLNVETTIIIQSISRLSSHTHDKLNIKILNFN